MKRASTNCIALYKLCLKGKGVRMSNQVTSLSLLLEAVRLGQRLRLSDLLFVQSDPRR